MKQKLKTTKPMKVYNESFEDLLSQELQHNIANEAFRAYNPKDLKLFGYLASIVGYLQDGDNHLAYDALLSLREDLEKAMDEKSDRESWELYRTISTAILGMTRYYPPRKEDIRKQYTAEEK